MSNTAQKRQREKEMVSQMIALYCRKHHGGKGGLCPQCRALEEYARARSDKCPFMEGKDLLLQLQGALLQAGDAGENPGSDAVLRPADAAGTPRRRPSAT